VELEEVAQEPRGERGREQVERRERSKAHGVHAFSGLAKHVLVVA
jgi:hypothetical protein